MTNWLEKQKTVIIIISKHKRKRNIIVSVRKLAVILFLILDHLYNADEQTGLEVEGAKSYV